MFLQKSHLVKGQSGFLARFPLFFGCQFFYIIDSYVVLNIYSKAFDSIFYGSICALPAKILFFLHFQ